MISFTSTTIFYLSLAFFINLLYSFLIAARFSNLLTYFQERMSILHSFYVFCISKCGALITPFLAGSLLTKPLACKHYGNIPLPKGLFLTLLEQVLDFGILIILLPILLLFLGTYFFALYLQIFFILFLLAFVLFVLIKHELFITFIWKFKNFVPKILLKFGKKRGITQENTSESLKQIKESLTNKRFLLSLIPYIFIQIILMPFVLYFVVKAFSFNLGYSQIFLTYWASTALGKISGLPGGFGSTDLTMGGLLFLFRIGTLEATSIILAFRIITLAPALIIGGYLTFYLSALYSLKKIK
ncbi:MAG: lysylphosphatidylglycerol synthase transmembrane domain-containing protein [Candidatus Nanoarchaeia archaeon]